MDMTSTATPSVTPTVYIEQDSTGFPSAPLPSLSATSPATTLPASVPSATVKTVTSSQTPIRTIADATGKVPLTESVPGSITINLRAQEGAFSPSSITVPAGAEVTIVFDIGMWISGIVSSFMPIGPPRSSRARPSKVQARPPTPSPRRRHRASTCWGAASRPHTGKGTSSSRRDRGRPRPRSATPPAPRCRERTVLQFPLPETDDSLRGRRKECRQCVLQGPSFGAVRTPRRPFAPGVAYVISISR